METFLKRNLYKLGDMESKRQFEDMLGFYVEKLARREHSIQTSFKHLVEVRAKIADKDKERAELEEKLFE